MAIDTYYFDGHTAVSDADSKWTNDANAYDGNTATSATAIEGAGSYPPPTGKSLQITGTTGVRTSGTITSVRFRFRGFGTSDMGSSKSAVSINKSAEHLGDIQLESQTGSLVWSSWLTLTAPSGGWVWADINDNIKAMCYLWTGTGINAGVAIVELEVTYEASLTDPSFARRALLLT